VVCVFKGVRPQAVVRHTFFTMKVFARPTIHCKIDAHGRRLIDRTLTGGRLDAGA
jgi:hypothetical protein